MINEKVKLTKEQVNAVQALKDCWSNREETYGVLIKEKMNDSYEWTSNNFKAANSIDNIDFIKALFVGCEVQKTEQELFEEPFRQGDSENMKCNNSDWNKGYNSAWRIGVNFALRKLGKDRIDF